MGSRRSAALTPDETALRLGTRLDFMPVGLRRGISLSKYLGGGSRRHCLRLPPPRNTGTPSSDAVFSISAQTVSSRVIRVGEHPEGGPLYASPRHEPMRAHR